MPEALYIKEKDVSKLTGISVKTLQKNRQLKHGISFIKIGRSIFYEMSDVITFMSSHKCKVASNVLIQSKQPILQSL